MQYNIYKANLHFIHKLILKIHIIDMRYVNSYLVNNGTLFVKVMAGRIFHAPNS